MQDGLYPYLVVEKRNNDYIYIKISDLDILKDSEYKDLFSLDFLLQRFTEQEIKDSIIRANIVSGVDINDKRLLIKYGNYKLPILSKNIVDNFDVSTFISDNYDDKGIKNIFFNKLSAIVKEEQKKEFFKDILDNSDAFTFLDSLNYLSYYEIREFYFYIHNYSLKKQDTNSFKYKREKNNE